LSESAAVHHRGCSRPLQRALVDFAADLPFAQAREKLLEHYGIELAASTIRTITERHARGCADYRDGVSTWPSDEGAGTLVAEVDGGMVPIVKTDAQQSDRRTGKQLLWKEAKLCLAHALGSAAPAYGGTLLGGVATAGEQLLGCAVAAGLGTDTRVHAIGDGAPWIADQVAEQFGPNGSYLVDFYHVCEYLAAAAKTCAPDATHAWVERQSERLKTNRCALVLGDLLAAIEPPAVPEDQAPVRACHRYLANRREHLDYAGALAAGLPIGSGEIESAHRYVVQQRLKRPGAWWTPENAEAMLALRLVRANGQWSAYWSSDLKQVA
jgi:hypothetical protein